MADTYYKSTHEGAVIDEQITYVKDVAKSKIVDHEGRIGSLEQNKANKSEVVKYSEKNQPGGYVGLDENCKLPSDLLEGNLVSTSEKTAWNGHLSDFANPHGTDKGQVGLENVDNTSDMDKPVSIAQAAALNLKADKTDIPTKTSQLTNDSSFINNATFSSHAYNGDIHVTTTEKNAWNNKPTMNDLSTKADKYTLNGGFSGGMDAATHSGGAIGFQTYTIAGGAVGYAASSNDGGAIGQYAVTSDGFAGGKGAETITSDGQGIDAIQLGTGTNNTPKSLQVYNYPLMDASGKIPAGRIPSAGSALGGVKTGGDVTITSGLITVNDDSHNHTIANVDGLQTALALKTDKADFDAHDADEERHITPQERARWDSSAIVGDASGEKIVLDDVAPQGAIRELEIYGKSEQETSTQGKNLLDTTGIDNVYNGVTFARQPDGSVKVSGTSTGLTYSKHINITERLMVGKTYTKSMTGGVSGLSLIMAIISTDGTTQYLNTFTMSDTVDTVKLYLQIVNADVTVDTTVYLQVEEGSVATAYEPFVPNKPSPEYSSEIKSAENFTALFLRGKNLLDTTGVDNVLNGVAFERQSDGSVKVSGTSTALAYTKHINITSKLTVGKTYTKSWKGGVTGLSFVLAVIKKDGTVQYPTTFTFDSTMETVKLYLQITNAGVTVDTTVYPQLEEGSVATAYEPYGGTVVNIPYELRGVPNTTGGWLARDYIMVKDGAVKLVRECKEKTFDGTEVWFPYNPGGVDISSIGYTFYHILNDGAIGFQKSRCTHFKNVNSAWVAGYKDTYGIYSCSSSAGVKYFRAPDASITTVDGFKAWLAEKSAADDPVKLLYTLLAPTVEDITDTETGQALLALTLTAPDAAISNTAASGMAVYYEVDGTIAYKKLASAIVALGGTI